MPTRYERISERVLPGWEVSLVFVSPATAKRLNRKLRGKSYTPNVLSYPVGPKHGEILICREVAKKQAPEYGMSAATFTLYLFIHGLLNLEGRRHGATMERREQELLKRFSAPSRITHGTTHRHRHRHRDLSG